MLPVSMEMHNGNEKECLLNLYWPSNSWLPDVSCKPGRQKKYSLFSLNIFSPISFSFYSFLGLLNPGAPFSASVIRYFGKGRITCFFLSWCFLEIRFSPHLLLPPVDLFSNCISSESSKDSPELRFLRICSELGKKDFFYRGEWVRSVTGKEWQKFVIFCEKPFFDIVMLGFFIIA